MDHAVIPLDILVDIATYDPKTYGEMLMLCKQLHTALMNIDAWDLFTYIDHDSAVTYSRYIKLTKCRLKDKNLLHGKITRSYYYYPEGGEPVNQNISYYKYGICCKQEVRRYIDHIVKVYSMSNGNKHGDAWIYELDLNGNRTLTQRKRYRNGKRVWVFKEYVDKALVVSSCLCIVFVAYNMIKLTFS
ncbi:Hypothetical protein FSTVST1_440 [Faustovirus ST1]|nr:Hypothetical protein FSTVST1_440 [Faustovirus ST1]